MPRLRLGVTILGAASLALSTGQANANQIVRTCWFGTQIIGVEECGTNSYTLGDKRITYLQNPSTMEPPLPIPMDNFLTTDGLSTQISRQTS